MGQSAQLVERERTGMPAFPAHDEAIVGAHGLLDDVGSTGGLVDGKTLRSDRRITRGEEGEQMTESDYMADTFIALRAYFYWQQRGTPFGSPNEDWFKAIGDINREMHFASGSRSGIAD